jgi:hypothetical protein
LKNCFAECFTLALSKETFAECFFFALALGKESRLSGTRHSLLCRVQRLCRVFFIWQSPWRSAKKRIPVVYRVTTEEIGASVIQTVFKFSTQALSPYYKIITDTIHDYSTVAEFSPEDFAVPCIPKSPENRKKNEWPQTIC